MPSGNKIIGHLSYQHLNLEIYISSKTPTQGLCGSFDKNQNNDLFHRFTLRPSSTTRNKVIDKNTAVSWR